MRKRTYGRIINTISRAAEGGQVGLSDYAAAKAALWAVTRCVATEVADDGILVNSLIPGPTNTPIWKRERPEMQSPAAVYPTVKLLATLPVGGPSGKVFFEEKEFPLFLRTLPEGASLEAWKR